MEEGNEHNCDFHLKEIMEVVTRRASLMLERFFTLYTTFLTRWFFSKESSNESQK